MDLPTEKLRRQFYSDLDDLGQLAFQRLGTYVKIDGEARSLQKLSSAVSIACLAISTLPVSYLFAQWLLHLSILCLYLSLSSLCLSVFFSLSLLSACLLTSFFFSQTRLLFFLCHWNQLDIIWNENKWFRIVFNGAIDSLIFMQLSLLRIYFSYLNTFFPLGGPSGLNTRFKTPVTD